METLTWKNWQSFMAANWPLDERGDDRHGRRGYDAPLQRAILDTAYSRKGWPADSIEIDERAALAVIAHAREKLGKERRRKQRQATSQRRISPLELSRKSLKGVISSINDAVWAASHRTPEKCAIYIFHTHGAYSRSLYKVFIIVRPAAVAAAFRAHQRHEKQFRTPMVRKAIAYAIYDDETSTPKEREIAEFLEPLPDAFNTASLEAKTGDISVSVSLGLPASRERQLFVDSMAMIELGPRLIIRLRRGEGMDAQKIAQVMGESPVREVVSILTVAEAAIRDIVSQASNG